MERRGLNLSQKEIAASELVSGTSALNTISLRLYLPNTAPTAALTAVDAVLASADIFGAVLDGEAGAW